MRITDPNILERVQKIDALIERKQAEIKILARKRAEIAPAQTCAIDGCATTGPIIKGYCPKHYQRWLKYGNPHKVGRSGVKPKDWSKA